MNTAENERRQVRLSYEVNGQTHYVEMRTPGEPMTDLFTPSKPYHTFSGWEQVPAVMPDHDLVLHGQMHPLLFRAVFADGVEQYGVYDLPYGAPLTPPVPPKREGHEFVRWEGLTPTMPAENKVYEAVFTPCTYRVTYAVGEDFRTVFECRYGEPFPTVEPPEKPYHTFGGWSEHPDTVPAGDFTVTGTFSENLYRLTRIVDGEVFMEEWLPYQAKIDKKVKPEKEGYYFSGWRKLPDLMPAEALTVVASMYPTRYRVEFWQDNLLVECKYVPFGDPIPLPRMKKSTGEDLYVVWDAVPETMPARDLVVHGSRPSELFTLIYTVDGEEIYRTDLPEGSPLPQNVEPPEKEGYSFRGWKDEPEVMPASDLTLEAVYNTAFQVYRFVIDGSLFTELELPEGEALKFPHPMPSEGRPFGGWHSMESDPKTGVITYSGSYGERRGHLLTFTVRGDMVYSHLLNAGDPIVPPELPHDATYRFEGWESLPEVMPDHDLIIQARVRVLRYRLRFSLDGKVIYTMTIPEGVGVSCPAVSRREGYTFSGWQNVPKRMPPYDVTVSGTYLRNTHRVTYVIDGETLYTTTVPYGDPIPVPVPPAVEGKCFAGWDRTETHMPDRDLRITGEYDENLSEIRFYADGLLHSTLRLAVGAPIPLPEIPVGEGTRFVWQDVPETAPAGGLDLHGGHVNNRYTVTYTAGHQVVGTEVYAYGAPLYPRVKAPEVKGQTFLYWKDLPKTMPAHHLFPHAVYSERTSHITFRVNNQLFCEMDAPVGAPTPQPPLPERPGYSFTGWTNWGDTVPDYNFTVWGTLVQRHYTVTYLWGGDTVTVQKYLYGEAITPPDPPPHPTAEFREWEGLPAQMPDCDLTVSARYAMPFTLEYVLDGETVDAVQLEFGSRILPLKPKPRNGCVFMGWKDLPEYMPQHDLKVEGRFAPSTYTVTYKVGNIVHRVDSYEIGTPITPPTPPEREHEVFVRWRNFTEVMPDYDFTCTAEYADAIRHYSFVLDGKELASGEMRKGEALSAPAAPERKGFTFAGWAGYNGTMPGKDVTYTGSYVPNTHTVTYLLDGEVYRTEQYRRGAPVVRPTPPVKTGYLFSGWHVPETMPDHDLTLKGNLVARKYRLTYVADATAIFEDDVPCGTRLGHIPAPEIHGLTFKGWEGEPDVMPAEPLTVSGSYRPDTPRYKLVKAGDRFGAGQVVRKQKVTPPKALAIVSGSSLRIVISDICYPVEDVSHAIRNGRVIDPAKLSAQLRRTYREHFLPRTKVTLVFHLGEDSDRVYESAPLSDADLAKKAKELFGEGKRFRFCHLSDNPLADTRRTLISAVDEETVKAYETVFASCGVKLREVNTVFGALTAYLQPNRKLKAGDNQLCLFYLTNAITACLMVDGQVAFLMENRYPYPGGLDYLKETEAAIETAQKFLADLTGGDIITTLAVGGVDFDRVRAGKAFAQDLLNREIRGGKIIGDKTIQKLSVLRLGFGNTDNRT